MISCVLVGSSVPTFLNTLVTCPLASTRSIGGGGVKSRTAVLQLPPEWQFTQPTCSKIFLPAFTTASSGENGETGARKELTNVLIESASGLRPELASGSNCVTIGSGSPLANLIKPAPPETLRVFNSKSCTSSRLAEKL